VDADAEAPSFLFPSCPTHELTVPGAARTTWKEVVRLPGTVPEHTVDRTFHVSDERRSPPRDVGPAAGSVRVRVLSWDGHPVQGATVAGALTDAGGEVLFESVSGGVHEFCAAAPGGLPMYGSVAVRAGRVVDLVLREPLGARLEVTTCDASGRLLPAAEVRVDRRDTIVLDVVDGIQRLDWYTGADGRRSFARVQPGPTTVNATWGSRTGSTHVTLVDGETATIEIVLE
jgi:hypothetical protein